MDQGRLTRGPPTVRLELSCCENYLTECHITDDNGCGYEIRPTETRAGDGMFATRSFKPDAVILVQPCLIALELQEPQEHRMQQHSQLRNYLGDLLPLDQAYIETLGPYTSLVDTFDKYALWLPHEEDKIKGLYREICKINHGCAPNAVLDHKEDGMGEVRALQHIPKGTEIRINYLSPKAPKAQVEEKYGFECMCSACVHPQPESDDSGNIPPASLLVDIPSSLDSERESPLPPASRSIRTIPEEPANETAEALLFNEGAVDYDIVEEDSSDMGEQREKGIWKRFRRSCKKTWKYVTCREPWHAPAREEGIRAIYPRLGPNPGEEAYEGPFLVNPTV